MQHARASLALLTLLAVTGCGESITGPQSSNAPPRPSLAKLPDKVAANADWIVRYAKANWNRSYGSGANQIPFYDFGALSLGGNCTNFVSQAILGGFVGSDVSTTVYSKRRDYQVDRGTPLQWYYESANDRGSAWAGARELYRYSSNPPEYRGLHFRFIARDSKTAYLDYTLVKPGDIIFADWENDGKVDHSMVVVAVYSKWDPRYLFLSGYDHIRVAYQNANGYPATGDRGLGDINKQYKYVAIFSVYRVVDYSRVGR